MAIWRSLLVNITFVTFMSDLLKTAYKVHLLALYGHLKKRAYGLREAPRLWHLRARQVFLEAGLEAHPTAKACGVL